MPEYTFNSDEPGLPLWNTAFDIVEELDLQPTLRNSEDDGVSEHADLCFLKSRDYGKFRLDERLFRRK